MQSPLEPREYPKRYRLFEQACTSALDPADTCNHCDRPTRTIIINQRCAALTKANTMMFLEHSFAEARQAPIWLQAEYGVAHMSAHEANVRAAVAHHKGDLRTAMRLWRIAVNALQLELERLEPEQPVTILRGLLLREIEARTALMKVRADGTCASWYAAYALPSCHLCCSRDGRRLHCGFIVSNS